MSLVDLGKRLLDAAKRGDTDEVRTLMSNGAPFTTDWLGTSPLHFAAQYGHLSTAEVLLRAGISRDARTKVDRTPLHVAAQEGHVEIVQLLLQHAADIDAKDMLKMTPLHWATEKGHIPVIECLLKQGADVNCENKFDKTPLDISIQNGRPDIAQILQLAQHTDIHTSLTDGETVTVETTDDGDPIIHEAETITIGAPDLSPTKVSTANILPVTIVQNTSINSGNDDKQDAEQTSSTSVLATLAALAEATAPNQGVSTSDAMNWLESQGITMITTADGNIITSAVESGQSITLTEAGKIALNIIKRQQDLSQDSEDLSAEEMTVDETVVENEGADGEPSQVGLQDKQFKFGSEKVITIVSEHHDTSEESDDAVLITLDGSGDAVPDDELEEPKHKKIKLDPDAMSQEASLDIDHLLQNKGDADGDSELLRKQLEEMKRQAELYKEQLKQKDKDLEEYKKQLTVITLKSPEKA
ncbi:hypothetical protein CHS0354_042433 [Potamilus streckersoni]|uniref:GA-binding protein subunit beta-1 n=1 Tax=Potamilus streckersoni TaxID=2493646 RepID=A0AAE0SUQ5_9BIVA|nr:hypothetical protein CHS0354_042433 [Potamilus streckersoni]